MTSLYGWGKNQFGVLCGGRLGSADLLTPKMISTINGSIRNISTGKQHCIAITEQQKIYSWGMNDSNQLGYFGSPSSHLPREVLLPFGAERIKAISCGQKHTAILTLEGKLFTFGDNSQGQCGIAGMETTVFEPQEVLAIPGKVISVKCCLNCTFIILEQQNQLWYFGTLLPGNGNMQSERSIAECQFLSGKEVVDVSCGNNFIITVLKNGQTFVLLKQELKQIGSLSDKHSICTESGNTKSIILTRDGDVFEWDSSELNYNQTRYVIGNIKQISNGENHFAALTFSGILYMWGLSSNGRLGIRGSLKSRMITKPTKVETLRGFNTTWISCGGSFTMAIVQSDKNKQQQQKSEIHENKRKLEYKLRCTLQDMEKILKERRRLSQELEETKEILEIERQQKTKTDRRLMELEQSFSFIQTQLPSSMRRQDITKSDVYVDGSCCDSVSTTRTQESEADVVVVIDDDIQDSDGPENEQSPDSLLTMSSLS